MEISLFTAAMRAEFLRAMQVVGQPAPWTQFATIVPSTARIESYAWMTPSPGISRYVGHRRLAELDSIKYTIENLEYDGAFTVPLRDIEDDIVGGYKLRMNELTIKAGDPFRSRLVLSHLANGKVATCFDGSPFFATAHSLGGAGPAPNGFGGGGNLLTYTSSNSADGVVHRFCVLFHGGILKPLLLQTRKEPRFGTDAGTPQSMKAKKADYWIDLECACAYGWWHDAVMVEITNTPNLLNLFDCIDAVRQVFRRFTLPKALPTDLPERPHEQTQFNPANATIVCSTGLEQMFNHLLNEDRVGISVPGSNAGISSNIYYKSFGLVVTAQLDA